MSLKVGGVNGQLTIDQGTELDQTLTGAEIKRMKAEQARTWQDVTGSRAAGVIYTNNTGYSIDIQVSNTFGAYNLAIKIGVNSEVELGNVSGAGYVGSIGGTIPNGQAYSLLVQTGAISGWKELR